MMKQTSAVVVVLLAAVAGSASRASSYPRFSHVFNDPGTYSLLYNAASGPINETLRFTRALRLTSVVLPSQIIDFANAGTYEEDVSVRLYHTLLHSNHALVKTTLLARGRFTGKSRYGQELHVALHTGEDSSGGDDVTTTGEAPTVAVFVNGDAGSQYVLNVVFSRTAGGIYPWYSARRLSTSASVHPSCDVAGFTIGLSYVLL